MDAVAASNGVNVQRRPVSVFAKALQQERVRHRYTRHHVADQCGVSVKQVEAWERGEGVPDVQRFKRLVGLMRRLAATPPNWSTGGSRATLAEKAALDIQREVQKIKEPEVVPPVEEFHEGLKRLREAQGMSRRELAEVFGFVSNAVCNWESGHNAPSEENLKALYDVLPELKAAVDAGAVKAPIVTRRVSAYRSKAAKTVTAAAADSKPIQLTIVKPELNEPAPEPSVKPQLTIAETVPVKPELKPELKTGSLADAGARYAQARAAMVRAQRKANELREQLAAAEADLKQAEAEQTDALAALDAAVMEPSA